ncbi:Extracellular matrix protein FRAS1 [Camelus dromedarius]|uniref:Extracellular matrix protein FRAS1 n=1 Tax=Camelus dromedarius TaxID=9838 RepID=A0A5N4EF76_CAMDR|nr:Extracellular matrix protein FRAS1 [Camelus dromedarius]
MSIVPSLWPPPSPDCHPLCQHCAANLRNTGSVCLRCQNARYLLLGDRCVPDCPSGYYAERGACQTCNAHCGSCDSQASCTSCRDPNKVLLFGDCQHESCAPQYYLDFPTKTCKGVRILGACALRMAVLSQEKKRIKG